VLARRQWWPSRWPLELRAALSAVLAGTGSDVRFPRFMATSTPAVTAAAASVSTPASLARRSFRSGSEETPAGSLSLKAGGSFIMRRKAASPSTAADGSAFNGSVAEILSLIGSISGPHFLCDRI
jgi:hypothetical protein